MKGAEPKSLIQHRRTPHSDYDNYSDKGALRTALANEQRGLCCYCMGRLSPDSKAMKIEHWRSRSRYPGKQLDYRNLLGACLGGEGQAPEGQHCDTRKGDADLRWNPADPAHAIEKRICYGANGVIESKDEVFDGQLNDTLNLNLAFLRNNRKAVLDSVLHWWRQQRKPAPKSQLERQRDKYAGGVGSLAPYRQVAVWWLQRKLERMS